jgi:hypothetical protein
MSKSDHKQSSYEEKCYFLGQGSGLCQDLGLLGNEFEIPDHTLDVCIPASCGISPLGAKAAGNRRQSDRQAAIAPRELKFRTMLRCYAGINSTVWNFESVAYEFRSWLKLGPSHRKNPPFSSITRVFTIRFGHVRGFWEGLRA